MKRHKQRGITVLALLLAAGLLWVGGCREKNKNPTARRPVGKRVVPSKATARRTQPLKAQEVGVTAKEVRFGQWGPLTGPAALWGAVARGTAAYFDMINANGGIHGRRLKLLIRDDGYQPSRTLGVVKELVEKEKVFGFIGGVGTATGMAVRGYLAEKKIPWVGPASGSSNWAHPPKKYLFSLYPTYKTEAKLLINYLLNSWNPKKRRRRRRKAKKRIAFFYQNDDYGKEGLAGAREALEKAGHKLVAEVSAEVTDTDLSSQVLKLKKSRANIVILWLLPKHAAITLGTAAKFRFRPQWVSTSTLSDAPLMYKITKGLWAGTIFDTFIQLPTSEHPLIQKYKKAYKTYGLKRNPNERWGIFFLAGFFFAEPAVQALKNAGRDLTREKFVAALENLKNWDGGIGHKITFGPKERQGQKSVFLAKCQKGGKTVKLTDWLTLKE